MSIKELDKVLSNEPFREMRDKLIESNTSITTENIKDIVKKFKSVINSSDEKYFKFLAYSLSYTMKKWDEYKGGHLINDEGKLSKIESLLISECKNIKIRDISDIHLSNEDAYNHEMFGRGVGIQQPQIFVDMKFYTSMVEFIRT